MQTCSKHVLLDPLPSPLHTSFLIVLKSEFTWHHSLGEGVRVSLREQILGSHLTHLRRTQRVSTQNLNSHHLTPGTGRPHGRGARQAAGGRPPHRWPLPVACYNFVASCGLQQHPQLCGRKGQGGVWLLSLVCLFLGGFL